MKRACISVSAVFIQRGQLHAGAHMRKCKRPSQQLQCKQFRAHWQACAFTCAATAFALAEMPRPRPRTETVECLGDFQIQPRATLSYELDRLFLLQRNRPATMHRSQM